MELRYRMAVVTGAGSGLGRELAMALGRRGMAVLVADRDLAGAEETVALVRTCRVVAWACQVDLVDDSDVALLAGRARDLGGADVLVDQVGGWTPALTEAFLADLIHRRGPTAPATVVHVITAGSARQATGSDSCEAGPALVMTVVTNGVGPRPLTPPSHVCAAVIDLLAHGSPGQETKLDGKVPDNPGLGPRRQAT